MSGNANSWANIESSEDEEDEIVPEPASKSTGNSERVTENRKFYPPYVVEVSCAAFARVDRKTVGVFFEDVGCEISQVQFDDGEVIAHIEFKNEISIIKCFSVDGTKFKDSFIKVTATRVPSSDANNYNNRRSSRNDNQRGGGGGGGGERNGYRNTRDTRDRDRDYRDRDRDRAEFDNGRDGRNRPMRQQQDRNRQQFKPADNEETPVERPKIIILPRSLPVDSIGKPVASLLKPEIFGGGKPQDEAEYVRSIERKLLWLSPYASSPDRIGGGL